MTKEQVIRGCLNMILRIAREKGLEVEDNGTGHGFDGGFWEGIFVDDSNIPEVTARGEGYSIGLRSFWGSPEVDIRRQKESGEELLIFRWTDYEKNEAGEYEHTGNFHVGEIRTDCRWDYKANIEEIYKLIEEVENADE